MKTNVKRMRASGVFAIAVAAAIAFLTPGGAHAQARIDGISVPNGAAVNFTAGEGEISTPDGGSIHFWGYQEDGNQGDLPGGALPQYPGPTLILDEGATISINLKSNLHALNNPSGGCTSIIFPGHSVSAIGGHPGIMTRETCPGDILPVQYTFTASEPGTYLYHSGTNPELQIEMGLVGAIVVRPAMGEAFAYNHPDTAFNHEVMFLLTSIDPLIHQLAEQHRFDEIDLAKRWPVYWFINGRAAPDDLAAPFVGWLPHQPYNCTPRMTPGQRLLVRIIGGDQNQHPLHLHGNHYSEIARYGRLLTLDDGTTLAPRKRFTTNSVPGQTVDAIFEWTGEKLGWDIYGTGPDYEHSCNGISVSDPDPASAGFDPVTHEYCPDHGKPFPVVLPENQNLAFGGWWSGSPYMGGAGNLPPGEGGLNPFGGFFFMWHSHAEKELTNFDIFPGGMLSMMVIEPPGTPIP